MKTNILNNMKQYTKVICAVIVLLEMSMGAWGKVLNFDFSSAITEWPTATGSEVNKTYTLEGTSYTFTLGGNVYCASTETYNYLMLKYTTYLGLPAIPGYKLVYVRLTTSPGGSTATKVAVCSDNSGTTITGGDTQTLDAQNETFDYYLSGTSVNTMYYLYVTNKNCQLTNIKLIYESTSDKFTVSFDPGNGTYTGGNKTESTAGGGITLPTATPSSDAADAGWSFAGWSFASCSERTTEPTLLIAGNTYYPYESETLYAVYSKNLVATTDYTIIERGAEIVSGEKYVISAYSGGSEYALTASIADSYYLARTSISPEDGVIDDPSSTITWTLSAESSFPTISLKNGDNYAYVYNNTYHNLGLTTTKNTFTIGEEKLEEFISTFYFEPTTYSGYYIEHDNSRFETTNAGSNENIYLYKRVYTGRYNSNPCTNIVTLSEGTKKNVTSITFSPTGVATCSETPGDREVTVTVTPSSGYVMKSHDDLTYAGDGTATYVSGPTLNADKYEFVYRFAQNDNGEGTFSATAATYTNYLTRCGYSITYDCNDASSGCPAYVGRAFRLPNPLPSAPTKTGYSFAGWYTDASFSSAALAGATLSDNITLYAKWTQSVKLHDNNGDSHSGSTTATFNAGGPLSVTAPTRTGYSVEGYYAEVGCTNKVMTDEGALVNYSGYVESSKWIHSGATTLYTKWSPNTNTPYTVKHYKQNLDGTYPASPDDTDNLTGTTAASVTPAVKSYTGFTAPSTQTVTILADGSLVVTYNYTRNSYTLAWALDGGSISSAGTAAGSVKYGASLTAPTVTKTGYTFSSWSPSVPATMPAANYTYTAQWSANTVTITWNANGAGATVSPTSSSYTYDGSTVTLPTPTRPLSVFTGWYTEESGGAEITEVGTTNKPTEDVTYYAHWRVLSFEVKDQAGTGTADIHLTSTRGVTVYATSGCGNLITIKADNLDAISNLGGGTANKQKIQIKYLDANNGDAEVTGTDRVFRLCNDGIDPANYNNADGSNINLNGLTNYSHTYSISYTPSAYGVEDHYKLQLRLQNNNTEAITITFDLYGRALPEEFVIAEKKGDQWYALPNSILDNNRAITPLKITVNDPSTPTAATYAPSEAVYKGTSRYASGTNVYGIRLTDPDGHWLQVSSSSGTNYVWVSGTGSTTCQDWKLSSSDFNRYTLTIPSSGAGDKKFGINNLGNIGYFASDATGLSANVYLLPITNKYTDIPATIHEWGEHGVIIQPTTPATLSSVTSATMNVDTDDPTTATATAVNAAMGTAKYVRVYAAGVTVGGVANEGKQLYVHWKNSGGTEIGVSQVTIPCVIAEDATMSSIANTKTVWAAKSEVHILPGVTLDANAGSFAGSGPLSVSQMEIYPGATLKVSTGTFNATTLRLRCGWTRAGDKEYDVARVHIADDAALQKTTASMDYDIYEKSDGKHYYPLAVPFRTLVSTINYADAALASAATYGKHFGIDKYDGANRAENGATDENWVQMTTSEYLEPGKGYTITAVSSKGSAIIRVPLTFDNAWTADGEKATIDEEYYKNQVAVTAYTGTASTGGGENNRNAGWNILGVPYMSCFDASDASASPSDAFTKGKLNFITGEYTETNNVYVNVPVHDFSEYIQKPVSEAKLLPGWCFFVQFGKNGTLSFAVDGQEQSSSLPIYAPKREDMPEVKTGIILSNGDKSDQTTLLISDKYSADEYEINADLEKMFGNGYTLATYSLSRDTRLAYNAMSTSDAKKVIPIGFRAPEDGEYTFSLNPRYAEAAVERVDLIDYQTGEVTNLMMSDYTFTTVRTQDDKRFALNVVPMAKVPTGVEDTDVRNHRSDVRKIVIDDHVYIIHNGLMYDSTGKRVTEINK